MRYFTLFLLITNCTLSLPGQKVHLHQLKFSDQIREELAAGKLTDPAAAYYYSYIGKYKEALESYEVPLEWGLTEMTAAEKAVFQQYKPVNAYDYLAERTQDEQIVIISEAHHKPQHRVFTRNMLKSLYANGFRYMGIEALTPNYDDEKAYQLDDDLQKRGYPLFSPRTGTYTMEPQMGNMIREAIAMGFQIFGYEGESEAMERDLWQAHQIKRFMDEHPEGKVVIHCGWYHAVESDLPKYEGKEDHYMAYHLKQLTGIDPLTIYQDALTERFVDVESPYYNLVSTNEESVLVNAAGEAFHGKPGTKHFDILLYHPPARYRKNRPSWLYHIPDHTFVAVKHNIVPAGNYPVLVKAYRAEEPAEATPADIIELASPHDKTYLVLKKGKYRVVMADRNGAEWKYDLEFN
ncbi:MAG: hypothetical protein R2824_19665 [Saprospiraceae bacterium]|nr:hypothetical protein [Lewinella sp.]